MQLNSKNHGNSVTQKVTEGEADVLALILQNEELTQSEIATQLNMSRKTVSVRIRALKEKNLVRRIGSDTKGRWEVIVAKDSQIEKF